MHFTAELVGCNQRAALLSVAGLTAKLSLGVSSVTQPGKIAYTRAGLASSALDSYLYSLCPMATNSLNWQQSTTPFQPFVEHLMNSSKQCKQRFHRFDKPLVENCLYQASHLPQQPVSSLVHINGLISSCNLPAIELPKLQEALRCWQQQGSLVQTAKKKRHMHGAAEHSYSGVATVYLDDAQFNVVSSEVCAAYAMLLKTNMLHKLGDQLTRNVAQMSTCSVVCIMH